MLRIILYFRSEDNRSIELPLHYNYLIQGMIYNLLSPKFSEFLHNKGFLYGKRKFKLFTFSRIFGKYKILKYGKILFSNQIHLYLDSPIEQFTRDIADSLLYRRRVNLLNNRLKIEKIEFPRMPSFSTNLKIRTLSPITVYSTLLTPEGKKKTYFYNPKESEFSELVSRNAKKKSELIFKRRPRTNLKIEPLQFKESVVLFKGSVVKGWTGRFVLKGPITLIKAVYLAGLGSKNSQGFGMFEVIT